MKHSCPLAWIHGGSLLFKGAEREETVDSRIRLGSFIVGADISTVGCSDGRNDQVARRNMTHHHPFEVATIAARITQNPPGPGDVHPDRATLRPPLP